MKMQSSMRGITRILRVARTIADLDNSDKIKSAHLLEAISYRRKV
jgi:magnesium chelatase family protein